jgi:beta-galactosidase/beta-glucuronidase
VQLSPDGQSWKTAASAAGKASGTVETALNGQNARFIRVLCEAASGANYIIREIEVAGENGLSYRLDPLPPPGAAGKVDETQRLTGGNWKLQRASEVKAGGKALSQNGFDDASWLPAIVPGTILTSYLKAGAIPDPNYDDWQFQISDDFFTADFWYRNQFEIPASQKGRRVFLNFDSINWKADVYFNGQFLPNPQADRKKSIEGAFVRGKFDVSSLVNFGGPNYLAVYIYKNDTPAEVTTQGLAEGPGPNGGNLGADNPTMHAAIGWDWLPTIRGRDTGIFEDVYLSYAGEVELLDPWIETRLGVREVKAALSVPDLARELKPALSSAPGIDAGDLAALIDGDEGTQWIAQDLDGEGFTLDFGKPTLAGAVTILWGIEAGGRAADLESRQAQKFKLESSVDGQTWINFDAYAGGEVEAMFFGKLKAPANAGTAAFEGHSISDSIQGPTARPEVDMTAMGWGKIKIPIFSPTEIRYLRFTSLERRLVDGALRPTRIREFRVYAQSPDQVEQSNIRSYSVNRDRADLTLRTELRNSRNAPVKALVTGTISPGNIPFEKEFTLAAGETKTVEIPGIVIPNPELWWPVTYGGQFLYTADVRVSLDGAESDKRNFKFGVREFSYPIDGGMLTVFCNGVRIVCKGGNWGLDDGQKQDTPEVYDHKVRLHAEANMTMIRNWVGMTSHQAFYDACDKYGVLIWDDFWLANPVDGPNPTDPAMFLYNAVDRIKRTRHHAALAVYCGRNESAPPPELDAGLAERTAAYDGTRFYFPNSAGPPVGSGGGYSLAVPGGNNGVKQYFNDVTSLVLRSERGIPNVPALESLRKFVKPENLWPISEVWALHDWTYNMNGPANTYMSTLKLYIDGDFTVPPNMMRGAASEPGAPVFEAYRQAVLKMDVEAAKAYTIEDFNRMAQMINYDNHRGMFEALTTRRSNGMLMWMSQSSWPSFMWQTYDWYLDTNGGYFGAKAGNQPTHAVWDPRDNRIILHNATARRYEKVRTTVALYDLNGKPISSKDYVTDVLESDAYGIQVAGLEFSSCPTDLVFIKLLLKDGTGQVLGENLYWHNWKVYQDYRALSGLAPAALTAAVSGPQAAPNGDDRYTITVTNATAIPAVQVRVRTLDAAGEGVLPVFYSDNYFALMPGESKEITAEFNPKYLTRGGAAKFEFSGWNVVVQTAASR